MSDPTPRLEPTLHQAKMDGTVARNFSAAYQSWVLFMLCLAFTLNFIDRNVILVLAQSIKAEFHLSDFQLGALGGFFFGVLYTTCGIPIARLCERHNRVKVLSLALTIWSMMTALCGFASGFWQLALCRIGVGMGEAGCAPPAQSIISDYFSAKRRATAMSIYAMGVPLGSLIGVVGGGWLAQDLGWRAAFVLVGLPGIGLALIMRLTLKNPPRGGSEPLDPHVTATAVPSLRAVLRKLMARPSFVHICIGFSLSNIAGYGIANFIITYFLREFRLGLKTTSTTVGIIAGLAAMGGTLAGGLMADWLGRRDARWYLWAPAMCLVITPLMYVATFVQDDWVIAVGLLMIPSFFQNAHLGTSFGTVHNLIEPRMRATATAVLFLVINLTGMGLGPPLVGALSDHFASAAFPLGDFASVCQGGVAASDAAPQIKATCMHASAMGNRYAMISAATIFLWSAIHYFLAGRHLPIDLRRVSDAE